MLIKRRDALLALASVTAGAGVLAQSPAYPSKPVRWVLGYPPGGGSDFVARQIAQVMSKGLGQPLVIDNRPGAATIIAAEIVSKAAADGYTIFSGDNGSLVFNPSLYEKLPYNPTRDLMPVGLFARFHLLLVVSEKSAYKDARSLIADLKKKGSESSYGSPGPGSPHHLATELFKGAAELQSLHVPYKGAGPAITNLIGGQFDFMFLDLAAGLPQIKGGKIRALAVASPARIAALPSVPTLQELGYRGFEASAWQGLVVPTGTPADIVARLGRELALAMKDEELRAKLAEAGVDVLASTPDEFKSYIAAETKKWEALIKLRGISLKI